MQIFNIPVFGFVFMKRFSVYAVVKMNSVGQSKAIEQKTQMTPAGSIEY